MESALLVQSDGEKRSVFARAFACASKGNSTLECPSCATPMVFVPPHMKCGSTISVAPHFRAKAGHPHSAACHYKDDPTQPAITKKLLHAIRSGSPILLRLNFDTGLGLYDARHNHPRIAPKHVIPDHATPLGAWLSRLPNRHERYSFGCRDISDVIAITDEIKDIAGVTALNNVFVDHHRIVQPWSSFALGDNIDRIADMVIGLAHGSHDKFTQFTRGLPALFTLTVTDWQFEKAIKAFSKQPISYLFGQEIHSLKLSKNTGIKFSPMLPPALTRDLRDSGRRTFQIIAAPSIKTDIGRNISNSLQKSGVYEGALKRNAQGKLGHTPVFLNLHIHSILQCLPFEKGQRPVPARQLKFGFT